MKKNILILIMITFALSLFSTVIIVPDHYSTIQAAVNAASTGDEIMVRNGTYTESITINIYGLILYSENGSTQCTIISPTLGEHCIEAHLHMTRLEGFTFTNATNGALVFQQGISELKNCIFEDNEKNGLPLIGGSAITAWSPFDELSGCTFKNNVGSHTVVICSDYILGYNPTVNEVIKNNLFLDNTNTANYPKDLSIMNASSNYCGLIENNTFVGSSGGIHIVGILNGNADLIIKNNIFYNAGISNETYYPDNVAISYCSFTNAGYQNNYTWGNGNLVNTDPQFCPEGPYECYLLESSPCIDTGDPTMFDLDGTRSDMGCYPTTTEIKGLQGDGYNWVSFPRLDRNAVTNEGENIVPYMNQIYSFDDIQEINVVFGGNTVLSYNNSLWSPANLTVCSSNCYKIDIDSESEEDFDYYMPMTGTRLVEDYVIQSNFYTNTDYWLGYWLLETRDIVNAFGSLWNNVETISAEDWYYDKCSNNRGIDTPVPVSWSTSGKNLEYGKGYIITFNTNFTNFCWTPSDSREITEGYDRIETTYFTYNELPSYEVIDVLDIPSNVVEIGVFQEDVCVGAIAVQDSCEQILVYTQPTSREEIPFTFEVIMGRELLSSPVLDYLVYNEITGEFESGNVIAGQHKDSIIMFENIGEPQNEISINENIKLHGNYPNPFNPKTNISFSIPSEQKVTLTIYNLKGQKVKELMNGNLPAGEQSVVWEGKDENGKQVASGLYFYKLKTGKKEISKKMLLLK